MRNLILANSQVTGLYNSLSFMNPGIQMEECSILEFGKDMAGWSNRFQEFDVVFVIDQFLDLGWVDAGKYSNVVPVPHLEFRGFHPDLCYAIDPNDNGRDLNGPIGPYHSAIALAAHRLGLGTHATLELYCHELFSLAGFYQYWDEEKRALLKRSANLGFDVGSAFRRWTLDTGAFMYSVNHPKIQCLWDVAELASRKIGLDPVDCGILPADTLVNGPIMPVYPDLAERLGVEGSTWFKVLGYPKFISLETFVAASHADYDALGAGQVEIHPEYRSQFNRILAAVEEVIK